MKRISSISYINAHGSDHGLSIEIDLDRRSVTIREWAECCEPDEHGSYSPHVVSATIWFEDLLAPNGKHRSCGQVKSTSQREHIATLAINWLAYWGGDEERVDDSDRPCDHFGSWWGRNKTGEQLPDHLTCPECGAKPASEP